MLEEGGREMSLQKWHRLSSTRVKVKLQMQKLIRKSQAYSIKRS